MSDSILAGSVLNYSVSSRGLSLLFLGFLQWFPVNVIKDLAGLAFRIQNNKMYPAGSRQWLMIS